MTQTSHSWRQWVEPWYFVYAIQGALVAGLLPIILPLVVSHGGSAASIGLVMAAFSLGGLTAPLWGGLADRYRLHRWLLVGGQFIMTAGLAVFAFTSQTAVWIGLALFLGFGAAGAATVANLFVVEAHPKAEWDERIGWLQTFYGVGQVGGLLLAGGLSQTNLKIALIAGAGLSAVATLAGWLTTHTPPASLTEKPVLRHPARHGEWVTSSPQRLFHHLDLATVKKLGSSLGSPFGLFMGVWILAIAGSGAFFSQYPILMQQVYGISPGLSSGAFAVVAGIGLLLYTPGGNWSDRFGPSRVMQVSLAVRWVAFVGLLGLAFLHTGLQNVLALAGFGVVVCAWSLISVSGTALAAKLSPVGEGEGLGIFNAVSALAGVIGAVLGGWAAGRWGYGSIAFLAVAGIALSLVLSYWLPGAGMKAVDQAKTA